MTAPAPAVQILRLDHVQLAMPQGQEAVAEAFYGNVLGFRQVQKPEHLQGRGGCWFAADDVKLHLGVDGAFVPARKAHPAFVVNDLAALQSMLESHGVEITWDTQLLGFTRFYVSDPFGNRLEFMQQVDAEHV